MQRLFSKRNMANQSDESLIKGADLGAAEENLSEGVAACPT
jgi:hypothetical protein